MPSLHAIGREGDQLPARRIEALDDIVAETAHDAAVLRQAKSRYREFHGAAATAMAFLARRCAVPVVMRFTGPAAYILYRSCKADPLTAWRPRQPISYIHEHSWRGLDHVELFGFRGRGGPCQVPREVAAARVLVWLGEVLELGWIRRDGGVEELVHKGATPSGLFTIPSGRALLITDEGRVSAMLYGGKLGVRRRGIVG